MIGSILESLIASNPTIPRNEFKRVIKHEWYVANRDRHLRRCRDNYYANHEQSRQRNREYYAANRESRRTFALEYYYANRDRYREWARGYYANNRSRKREYYAANIDRYRELESTRGDRREYYRQYRAAKKNRISEAQWAAITTMSPKKKRNK